MIVKHWVIVLLNDLNVNKSWSSQITVGKYQIALKKFLIIRVVTEEILNYLYYYYIIVVTKLLFKWNQSDLYYANACFDKVFYW